MRGCKDILISYYLVIYLNVLVNLVLYFFVLLQVFQVIWVAIDPIFPSDPLISCFYSSIFPVVSSRTAFVSRKGLMYESEARLIYCWTRSVNLSGIFIVVKSASVISREQVLRWGLELNLGDRERKGDILENFWLWWFKDLCDVFVL